MDAFYDFGWRVHDDHPGTWQLSELRYGIPWDSGDDALVHQIASSLVALPGARFEVRAADLAGNQRVVEQVPSERLFAIALGDADGLDLSLGTYRLFTEGAPYRIALVDFVGAEWISIPVGGGDASLSSCEGIRTGRRVSLYYASSILQPLAELTLSYQNPAEAEWTKVGLEEPSFGAEFAAVWNTVGVDPMARFMLHARDITGRAFDSPVVVPDRSPCGAEKGECIGDNTLSVHGSTSEPYSSDPDSVWADLVSLTPGSQGIRVPVSGTFARGPYDGTAYDIAFDVSSLPDCIYTVAFGWVVNGATRQTVPTSFNRCRSTLSDLTIEGTNVFASVRETYPAAVANVDVYAKDLSNASWHLAGRTGPLDGTSPAIPLDTASGNLCGELTFKLQTTLLDGTVVNEPQTPSCTEKTVKLGCGDVRIASPVREPPGQRCLPHKVFTAAIAGTSPAPIADLRAFLVTATGGSVGEASISGFSSGTAVNAIATFSTEGLPDGPYFVKVVAHDSSGTVLTATSRGAALADSVPPVASITAPATGAFVCSSPAGGGSTLLQVHGSATDNVLSTYEVSLRDASTGLDVRRFDGVVSTSGALASFDLQGLNGGDYLLGLEARDQAGNASCAPDVSLRIPGAPQIAEFDVSASVFAPGDAAPYGTTDVQASLQDVASLSLYLADGSGGTYPVHTISAPTTALAWTWDGDLQGGSRPADGDYLLHADAMGSCGGHASAVTGVAIDTLVPAVEIDDPSDGAVVAVAGPVAARVVDAHLARTRVSLGAGRTPVAFVEVATVDGPSVGPLPVLPLGGQPPGEYTVLVEAWDVVGHFGSSRVTFLWGPGTLIDSFDVAPVAVSPNGDGIQDGASALLGLTVPASVTLDVIRGDGTIVVRAVIDAQGVQGSQVFTLDTALRGVAEGAYQVRATARAGTIEQSATRALVVDLTPPSIQVSSPAANAYVRGATDIIASVDDPLLREWHVARRAGGQDLKLASGIAKASGVLASLAGLPDGPQTVVVVATDAAGNRREVVVPFVSDSTPPQVAITAPIAGTYLSSSHGPLLISGTVADQNIARWRLEYGSSTGSDWTSILDSNSPPLAGVLALWAVPVGASGPAQLRLTATDLAGNDSSTMVAVVIDNTPPIAAIESPRDVSVATVDRIGGHVSDDNLQGWVLELSDGAPGAAYRFVELARGDRAVAAGGDLAVLAGQLQEGPYTARLTVTDKAGNISTDVAGFFVDRTPPLPPPGLQVALRPKSDAVLTWLASPDPDVVGYRVLRAWGDGAFSSIAQGSMTGLSYADTALRDGTYRYEVIAIDAAGLESGPSPVATLEVDTTPPAAFLTRPASGAFVHVLVDVIGTASSAADFREYRLSWGLGASPASFTLVKRGTSPVVLSVLGTVDTRALPQLSTITLRLEAEDLSGNVAEARATIQVNNDPPGAPVLVTASPQGSDVTLTWQAPASADVLGYLVFRNGAPRVLDGTDLSDPTPYLVPAGTTTFVDRSVPDGTFMYQIQAFDRALNASGLSNSISVTLDQHAPSATILVPTPLARLSGSVTVVADSVDLDVTSVRIEARAAPSGTFVALGTSTARPYTAQLDPAAIGGVIEIRAIATDKGGRSDLAPQSVFAFYDPPLLAAAVAHHVDRDQVSTTWTDPNPAGRLAAVTIEREGVVVSPATVNTSGTATATATSSGSPASAMDGRDTTWWQGHAGSTWQLVLSAPALVRAINVKPTGAGLDLYVRVKGAWARVGAVAYQGTYVSTRFAIDPPLLIEGVQARVTNPSGSGLYDLTMDPVPLTAAPVVETFMGADDVQPAYTITTWGTFGRKVTAQTSARVYRPLVDSMPTVVGQADVTVAGSNATPNASVAALKSGSAVSSARAQSDGRFSVPVTLVAGDNSFQVQATDDAGNRSRLSAPFAVRYEPPPQVALTLWATGITGSDVALSFTVDGDTSTFGGFEVVRSASGVSAPVGRVERLARTFLDRSVPNGTFDYRVQALSQSGVPGSVSNAVTVTVSLPTPAAPSLTLSNPAAGGELALAWTFVGAARFQLERAVAAGSFLPLGGTVTGNSWLDSGLMNGTSYSYRAYAIDPAGNIGPYSNVVSGTPVDSVGPDAPTILEPTVAGSPFMASNPLLTVAGVAELGARVELAQNGRFAGAAPASLRVLFGQPIVTSYPSYGSFDIAPSGEPFAYSYRDATWKERIAVEWPSQGRVATFDVGAGLAEGPRLSPDAKSIAFIEWDPVGVVGGYLAYQKSIQLGDLQIGMTEPLLAADGGGESYLSWSPDGSRLLYLAARTTTDVVLADLSTRTETRLPSDSGGADRPGWISASAIGYVGSWGSTLVRQDLATGVRTTLANAVNAVRGWSATDDGRWVAALLADYSHTRVYMIGDAGISPAFPEDAGKPVFSADGTQLATYAGGHLIVRDVAAGTETDRGSMDWPTALFWPQTGLCYTQGYRGPHRAIEAGRFEIPVRLDAGANVFVATATDASGNRSRASASIEVDLDTSTLPDLTVSARVQPATPVTGDHVQALVTVTNQGSASSAGTVSTTLAASDGSTRQGAPVALGALAPGESVVAVVPLDVSGLSGAQSLTVSVDAPLGTPDRDLTNNQAVVLFRIAVGTEISLAIEAQPPTVTAGGTIEAKVSITNPGPAVDGVLRVTIVDQAGGVGVAAPEQTISLGAASVRDLVVPVAVGGTLAGNYRLTAELVASTQRALASAPFTVLADTSAGLRLSLDRASYLSGEDAFVDAVVSNLSLNAPLDGATVSFEVRDSSGVPVIVLADQPVPWLWMGGTAPISTTFSTRGLPGGTYQVHAVLHVAGATVASADAQFDLIGRPLLVGSMGANGQGDPPAVPSGSPVTVSLALENDGSETARSAVARLLVVEPVSGTEVQRVQFTIGDLSAGAGWAQATSLPTDGMALGVYGLSLLVTHDGVSEVLATGRFRVLDAQPPTLELVGPANGAIVRSSVLLTVVARDDASGLASVTAVSDGGSSSLARLDGTSLVGTWSGTLALGADGPHQVTVSAADNEGNDGLRRPTPGNPLVLSVVSDTIPPTLAITGVSDGVLVNSPVIPGIEAADLHLAGVYAQLNGMPFASGAAITVDDSYVLTAQALDAAGNTATAAVVFTIDRTPPTISVLGVAAGTCVASDVTPLLVVSDRHPGSHQALLDGVPFAEGRPVTAEGSHALSVHAVDAVGNTADATVSFCIDKTPPVVEVAGVVDGAVMPNLVVPTFSATDANLLLVAATLNGAPFVSGTAVGTEGTYTLHVMALDAANLRADRTVTFTVVTRRPTVVLTPTDGSVFRVDVTPAWSATDAEPAAVSATLDGSPLVAGTTVTAEGNHVVAVIASNVAGSSTARSGFLIDKTPPVIAITGVADGDLVNSSVLPQVTATDPYLASDLATLDDVTWLPGQSVSADGVHLLAVVARDTAGNEAQRSVRFEIDKTPPVISASVVEGTVYDDPVTVTFGATDAHLGDVTATLDGQAVVSGTLVDVEGAHTLVVVARDLAGNEASKTVHFTLLRVKYGVDKYLLDRRARILARLPCNAEDSQRTERFLATALPGTPLTVVQNQSDLLVELRTGVYNVVLLTDVPGADASTGCTPTRPVPPMPAGTLDHQAEQELTEAAFRGVGIVVFRTDQSAWPRLVEALGLNFQGNELAGDVTVGSSAISNALGLAIPDGTRLQLGGALALGRFDRDGGIAAAIHGFGMGAAVALGFDPARAAPSSSASSLVSGAVAFVTSEAVLTPRSVAGVEIAVKNEARSTTTRVRETLDSALEIVSIGGTGRRLPTGEIEWSFEQPQGQTDRFGYLVRLPVLGGTFATSTEVAAVRSTGTSVWGNYRLDLVLGQGASELLTNAEELASAIPAKGTDGPNRALIVEKLAAVQANPGKTPADREQAISDLLAAVDAAQTLRTVDPTSLRLAIDALLAYWETLP